jgi:hypothetical protein
MLVIKCAGAGGKYDCDAVTVAASPSGTDSVELMITVLVNANRKWGQ